MTTIKALAVRLGLWLAAWGGWKPCELPHLPTDPLLDAARALVTDLEARFPETSGDFKRREAMRVLLNTQPTATARDLSLLIELALQ
jgi:hypothetical protein